MPKFSTIATKGYLGRLYTTYKFIEKINAPVSKKFLVWYKSALPKDLELISKKMHVGKSLIASTSALTKEQRQYKRALILLRCSLLWEEPNKVARSIENIEPEKLHSRLISCIAACNCIEKKLPPSVAYLEAKASFREMLKIKRHVDTSGEIRNYMLFDQKDTVQKVKNRRSEIFCPYMSDKDPFTGPLWMIRSEFTNGKSQLHTIKGGPNFQSLDDGGDLYIVGHGNYGIGIGTHHEHANEQQLVNAFEQAKLSKNRSSPIDIYLLACWTGTYTKEQYRLKKQPFAQRLANRLAQANYNNIRVIGLTGSLSNLDTLVSQYVEYNNITEDQEHKNYQSIGSKGMHCIYEIGDRRFRRVAGRDWIAKETRLTAANTYKYEVVAC